MLLFRLLSSYLVYLQYSTVQWTCLEEKEMVNTTAFPVPQLTGFASQGTRWTTLQWLVTLSPCYDRTVPNLDPLKSLCTFWCIYTYLYKQHYFKLLFSLCTYKREGKNKLCWFPPLLFQFSPGPSLLSPCSWQLASSFAHPPSHGFQRRGKGQQLCPWHHLMEHTCCESLFTCPCLPLAQTRPSCPPWWEGFRLSLAKTADKSPCFFKKEQKLWVPSGPSRPPAL